MFWTHWSPTGTNKEANRNTGGLQSQQKQKVEASFIVILKYGCTEKSRISLAVIVYRYRILRDPGGWLSIDKDTGVIKVKSEMDRESSFVKDDKYTALIGAYDNGG